MNGTTIYSVYGSQDQLLHRLNATTNTATDYIHIANTTVAEVERVGSSDTVRYPYFDHLGSAVKMGNASGGLISSEQAIFLPFGERWGTTNQAANGRGFTGHVDDTELGLTYMQARYDDPVVGRFYSNDPVDAMGHLHSGNTQGFNRYAYANNNPYSYVDPNGKQAEKIEVMLRATERGVNSGRLSQADADRIVAGRGKLGVIGLGTVMSMTSLGAPAGIPVIYEGIMGSSPVEDAVDLVADELSPAMTDSQRQKLSGLIEAGTSLKGLAKNSADLLVRAASSNADEIVFPKTDTLINVKGGLDSAIDRAESRRNERVLQCFKDEVN